ncbi:MAG: ion transporter [Ruminococcus sp.]
MSNYLKVKNRVFKIIEADEGSDIASKIFDIFIITLIIINVASVIIDTFSVPQHITTILDYIEIVSVIIFSVEYILRLWTANLLYLELGCIKSRLKYAFSFMAIIDLLAILPFYIPFIIPIDLRVLRALRIVRLLRMFKINRYTSALKSIATVFKNKSSELLSSMLVLIILMIISSVLMFNIESAAQPEAFDNAFSAFWWAIATLTTVGYGDIYPITIAGRVLSSIIALLSVALVAVPTGIISAGFMELIDNNKDNDDDKKEYCPYCGKKIK